MGGSRTGKSSPEQMPMFNPLTTTMFISLHKSKCMAQGHHDHRRFHHKALLLIQSAGTIRISRHRNSSDRKRETIGEGIYLQIKSQRALHNKRTKGFFCYFQGGLTLADNVGGTNECFTPSPIVCWSPAYLKNKTCPSFLLHYFFSINIKIYILIQLFSNVV